jgi:hypothetical protein
MGNSEGKFEYGTCSEQRRETWNCLHLFMRCQSRATRRLRARNVNPHVRFVCRMKRQQERRGDTVEKLQQHECRTPMHDLASSLDLLELARMSARTSAPPLLEANHPLDAARRGHDWLGMNAQLWNCACMDGSPAPRAAEYDVEYSIATSVCGIAIPIPRDELTCRAAAVVSQRRCASCASTQLQVTATEATAAAAGASALDRRRDLGRLGGLDRHELG